MNIVIRFFIALAFLGFSASANAAENQFDIHIKDHMFEPAVLEVPAGEKITLTVHNNDTTPEEFESHDLHREKVISGNSNAKIIIGPLEAGEYGYVGEFHEDTAQGKIIAKAK